MQFWCGFLFSNVKAIFGIGVEGSWMARSLRNRKFFQGSLGFSVLVVLGFLQRFSYSRENHSFGDYITFVEPIALPRYFGFLSFGGLWVS